MQIIEANEIEKNMAEVDMNNAIVMAIIIIGKNVIVIIIITETIIMVVIGNLVTIGIDIIKRIAINIEVEDITDKMVT